MQLDCARQAGLIVKLASYSCLCLTASALRRLAQVVLATSIDATLKKDKQISTHSMYFISADTDKAHRCIDLGLEQLEVSPLDDMPVVLAIYTVAGLAEVSMSGL